MPDDPAELAAKLRQSIEAAAGASFIGPDARTLTYTIDHERNHVVAYITVAFDGFTSGDRAAGRAASFVLSQGFKTPSGHIRLQEEQDIEDGFPAGAVLMWRGEGGTPRLGVDESGYWSVALTYALLHRFAQVVG